MADEAKAPAAPPPTKKGWQKVLHEHAGWQQLLRDLGADLQLHEHGFEHAPRMLTPQDQARLFVGAREILDAHGYDVTGSHTPILRTTITPRAE